MQEKGNAGDCRDIKGGEMMMFMYIQQHHQPYKKTRTLSRGKTKKTENS